jgi:nicotinate-nucleotide adenylyltransferase
VKTGVLGGTFDPPHLAHLVLAAAAREALGLDRVLFVPAGLPWRKADRDVTSAPLRVRMVEAAVADLEWAAVSTIEVQREGPSYAAETMRALASDDAEWWFILGADALRDLPHWREPQVLIEAARLAVARRGAVSSDDVPAELTARILGIESRIDFVPMPALDISSSALRQRIRAGQPTEVWLPLAVREVIHAEGLYRSV